MNPITNSQVKSVAKIARENAPTLIEHDGLRRVVSINGYYSNIVLHKRKKPNRNASHR